MGSKGHGLRLVIGGFRSVLCVSVFQGSLFVIVSMIDDSEKRNYEHRVECPVTSGNLTGQSLIRATIWSSKYGGIKRLKRLSEFLVSDCELLVTKSQWVPPEYLYQETSNSRSYLRLMLAYRISLGFSR